MIQYIHTNGVLNECVKHGHHLDISFTGLNMVAAYGRNIQTDDTTNGWPLHYVHKVVYHIVTNL